MSDDRCLVCGLPYVSLQCTEVELLPQDCSRRFARGPHTFYYHDNGDDHTDHCVHTDTAWVWPEGELGAVACEPVDQRCVEVAWIADDTLRPGATWIVPVDSATGCQLTKVVSASVDTNIHKQTTLTVTFLANQYEQADRHGT